MRPTKLEPGQEWRDEAIPGFGLRAHGSGASWFLAYRLPNGRRRRLKLGSYPATPLTAARVRALEAKRQVEAGQDPAAKPVVKTLGDAFSEDVRLHLSKLKTGPALEADLRRNLIRVVGAHRDLRSITRADIAQAIDRLGAKVAGNRALQYIKALFARFVDRGLLDTNPAATLRKRVKENPRDRVLSDHELVAVWEACDREGSWFGDFIRLLILTGMRRGEPLAGRFEGGCIVIDDPKQGRAHTVVLPRKAIPIAARFYAVKVVVRKCLGWGKRWNRLLRLAGVEVAGITSHDQRRTWATVAAAEGVDPLIVELCLGHVPSGVLGRVGAIYNRHNYRDQCAKAWELVAGSMERKRPRRRARPLPKSFVPDWQSVTPTTKR